MFQNEIFPAEHDSLAIVALFLDLGRWIGTLLLVSLDVNLFIS